MSWPQEPNWGTILVLLLFGTSPLVSAALFAKMLKNAAMPLDEDVEADADL